MLNRILGVLMLNLLLVSVGAYSIDAPIDSLYPQLGNRGYDVQHYDLEIDYDATTGGFRGVAQLTVNAIDTLETLTLDLNGMLVTYIFVNNEPEAFVRDGTKLTITPLTPIAAGETVIVDVYYEGVPVPDSDSGTSSARGWNFTGERVYVVSEPSGASTWYPSNDHPTDKATYTLDVTVPSELQVAASGLLIGIMRSDNRTTYHYDVNVPIASYLLTVNIGDYQTITSLTENGLSLRSFAPTALGIAQYQREIDKLDAMIAFFSETFGAYPFEAYGILVEPSFPNANEMQTLPVFNPRLVTERVMVHELAHQWFGNHVTLGDWSDIWLNEGFATYAEYLWDEHTGNTANNSLITRNGYQYVRTLPPPLEMSPDNLFPASVYHRGGWTLHALRVRVGDEVFFEILRTYYAEYGGGHAFTADFIAVAERISGDDLSAFFDGWLRQRTPPAVEGY